MDITACSINVNIMHNHLTATGSISSSDIKYYEQNIKLSGKLMKQKNGIVKHHATTEKMIANFQDITATQKHCGHVSCGLSTQ